MVSVGDRKSNNIYVVWVIYKIATIALCENIGLLRQTIRPRTTCSSYEKTEAHPMLYTRCPFYNWFLPLFHIRTNSNINSHKSYRCLVLTLGSPEVLLKIPLLYWHWPELPASSALITIMHLCWTRLIVDTITRWFGHKFLVNLDSDYSSQLLLLDLGKFWGQIRKFGGQTNLDSFINLTNMSSILRTLVSEDMISVWTEWESIWTHWAFHWSTMQTKNICNVTFILSIIRVITLRHSSVCWCYNFSAVLPFRINI